jgi:zinc protease
MSRRSAADDVVNAPMPAVAPPVRLPRIERRTLAGGVRLLVVRRAGLPLTDVHLVLPRGAAADSPAVAGRATLCAALLEEGTASRDAIAIAEALESVGAELRVRCGWDATTLMLHSLSTHTPAAMTVVGDLVRHADFGAAAFQRRQAEQLARIEQDRAEPRIVAARTFDRVVYGARHPYGAPIAGTADSVQALRREDVAGFHAARLDPRQCFLVAVGDVDADDFATLAERSLAGLAGAEAPADPLPAAPPAAPTAFHIVDRPGASQSEIRAGLAGPPRSSPDYMPLLVMNTVLGGSFTSRLNQRLREEKGFTYGARSAFAFRRAGGPFHVEVAVYTGNTAETAADILAEVRRMAHEPVPEPELARARNYLAYGLPRSLEAGADLAGRLAVAELHGLGDDWLPRYVERVQAVGPDDVLRAAAAALDAARTAVVVVGDRALVEPDLAALEAGPVLVDSTA